MKKGKERKEEVERERERETCHVQNASQRETRERPFSKENPNFEKSITTTHWGDTTSVCQSFKQIFFNIFYKIFAFT